MGILDVARVERRSVVARAFAVSPLRLLTPSNHGDAAWVFTSSYGGGLVGGDALHLCVEVGGASTLLPTQASTKVYRSRPGASRLEAARRAGARLLVCPIPTVCFEGASFAQAQHVDLRRAKPRPDGLDDLGAPGAGERWLSRYESRITIRYDERLVLSDALPAQSGRRTPRGAAGAVRVPVPHRARRSRRERPCARSPRLPSARRAGAPTC